MSTNDAVNQGLGGYEIRVMGLNLMVLVSYALNVRVLGLGYWFRVMGFRLWD